MLDIKTILKTTIDTYISSFTGLEKTAIYYSTDDVYTDSEQMVFSGTALAFGDVEMDNKFYSTGYDLNTYTIDCFILTKNTVSEQNIYTNLTTLSNLLRQNNLGQSGIINTKINKVYPTDNLTDRLKYKQIEILIKEIADVS